MKITMHQNDLPIELCKNITSVAIDTETTGLLPHRDRLCLLQLSTGSDDVHLIQFDNFSSSGNIQKILLDDSILKIFHYGRFDIMMIQKHLGVMCKNVYCTKIASKLTRTYTSKHSLADLCLELLQETISKAETQTDWGAQNLSQNQMQYAALDVFFLHKIKQKLDQMLAREGRTMLAQQCFDFLATRCMLDLMAGEQYDIFSHAG